MQHCNEFLQKLADGSYLELNDDEKNEFHLNMEKYPECEKAFNKMKKSIQLIKEDPTPDPGSEYWESFYDKLEHKMKQTSENKKNLWPALIRVAAMIFGGIFIGYLLFNPPDENTNIINNNPLIKQAALYEKTSDILEESKVLLLGIVNLDGTNSTDKIDFSFQKEISRNLIVQTADLVRQLKKSKNKRVVSLLNDLNVILMQIANIEESFDLPAIKMIQDGADRQSLIFKINMERLLIDAKKEHKKEKEISQKQEI